MEETKEPRPEALLNSRLPASKLTRAVSRRRFRVLRPLRIAPDRDNNCYYTDDHVRDLISDLRKPSSSSGSRRRAARKLRMLTKHCPENRLRIAAAGTVPALVSILQQTAVGNCEGSSPAAEAQLQEHAVMALYNLSLHGANLPVIAAAGTVSPAINTLACPEATPATRSGAACLLRRLAQHDVDGGKVLEDIGSSIAIPVLVDLLRTGEELRGQKDVVTALYELTSRWAPNCARAARAGLVPVLLELMENPGSSMVEKAAFLLSALVEADEARAEVVECGGVAVLVDMIGMGTREQREIAVNVLVRMSIGGRGNLEGYLRAAAAEGAVPALLAVAQPESGCSARSRRKAKALLEVLTPGARPAAGGNCD